MKKPKSEFESASPYKLNAMKPVPVAGFIIYKNSSVKAVSKIYHYRPPVLTKSRFGWYIRYYYRIPEKLRWKYENKAWLLFRIKEDINRRKGRDREIYAEWLLSEIEQSLKKGYNPFSPDEKLIEHDEDFKEKTELTATDAMQLFMDTWAKRGLEKTSLAKYSKVVNRFIKWLQFKKIPYIEIKEITTDHVQAFLNDMKKEHAFGNREFNNHYDFIRIAFNFLLKKKLIPESPVADIDKMKSKSTKHRYFDDKSLKDIIKVLEITDPYTLLAFYSVYYLCVRSEKELKYLKVGNINWEQSKILAEETKGGNERYIPFDNNLKEIYIKYGIDKLPDDYYLFSSAGKPSKVPFGRGYFSKRFAKARESIGLSDKHTLYSSKHTRIIHLKNDGVNDADIMSLTGHSDFTAYTKYLRDIGLSADIKNIQSKSRRI